MKFSSYEDARWRYSIRRKWERSRSDDRIRKLLLGWGVWRIKKEQWDSGVREKEESNVLWKSESQQPGGSSLYLILICQAARADNLDHTILTLNRLWEMASLAKIGFPAVIDMYNKISAIKIYLDSFFHSCVTSYVTFYTRKNNIIIYITLIIRVFILNIIALKRNYPFTLFINNCLLIPLHLKFCFVRDNWNCGRSFAKTQNSIAGSE